MRNSEYEGGGRRTALEQDKQMPCREGQTRETWMRMARDGERTVGGREQESDDERGKREKQV